MIDRNYSIYLLRRVQAECENVNVFAVAMILTESKFRGPIFRLAEILYSLLQIYALRIIPKTTIGFCQVSYPFWKKFYQTDIAIFRACFDLVACYKVCNNFIANCKASSVDDLLVKYNGKPSNLYVSTYFKNLNLVCELLNNCTRYMPNPNFRVKAQLK
jgi:hypothetical protein